mmetsp:Transcript_62004/g.134433  ORF Transcript_62004/g.134433 Transcript_62004/m.134433 type:complete len:254 (-) Transcript_62004:366-1127(-)
MLTRIAYDRKQDDPNEGLAHLKRSTVELMNEAINGIYEELRRHGNQNGGDGEPDEGKADGEARRPLVIFLTALDHVDVSVELEEEKGNVGDQDIDAADPGDCERCSILIGVVFHRGVRNEDRRERPGRRSQEQHRHVRERSRNAERLHLPLPIGACESSAEEGCAKDQQHVRKHTAKKSALHDIDIFWLLLCRSKCLNCEDHLHCISKGRVEETTQSVTLQTNRELLSKVSQYLGQRDHGQKVEPEAREVAPF